MDISNLESLISKHPIIFVSAAAFVAYSAFFLGWGLLEKRKRRKLEEDYQNLKENLKKNLLSYEELLREHAYVLKQPRIREMYRICARLPSNN